MTTQPQRAAAAAPAEAERLLASAAEGFAALDRQWRYVYVNDVALAMIGVSRETIIGRTPWEVFPSAFTDQAVPHVEEAIRTGRVVRYETWFGDRWFENRAYPSPTLISLVFSEITVRRRAESQLHDAEASQALLVAINDATRSLRDPVDVMWEVVSRVGPHFQVTRCTYGEIDEPQEHVLVLRDYVAGVTSVVGRHRLNDFGPALIADLRAGHTIAVPDIAADPRTSNATAVASFTTIETRSLLCVPLVKEGRFAALFVLHHRDTRNWSEGERALLEQVAERTWFAVENARAEAALRESRDVLSLVMRGARMGAWSRTILTNEVWWSRELEEIVGLPAGAFTGTESGFMSVVHEDDRAAVEAAVAQAIASGTDYVVEFRFHHARGEIRWMEGRGRAEYGDDGAPRAMYGVGIDITERKAAEHALADARAAAHADAERLGLVLAAARLGDWSWDVSSDVVMLSVRAAEIFDVPAGQPSTWTAIRDLLHPDDRERVRQAVDAAVAGHADYATEYRLINGSRERWVAASGRPAYDEQGHVVGIFGVVQDVTRDRVLLLIDDAVRSLAKPEEITFTAARILGEHVRANRCAYATVESDQDTFWLSGNYTHGVDSIVGRYTFTQFGRECLGLMRAGEPFVVTDSHTDERIDAATRASYDLTEIRAVICVPIRKGGRFVAAMAVHTRTPRQWLRNEVELVQQAASRCWESIERARVERERASLLRAAESANRAKDEFLAMLGHELRNPLSPIVTALNLMKLRPDGGNEKERTVIERQVTHLTRLVDDLLDVSRIARGKVALKSELCELSDVVSRGIEMASPMIEERSHVLTVTMDKTGLPVHGDAARLSQVVSNLLVNAAKYTPRGGHVWVDAARDGDTLVLRVADNGVGIPSDVLPHVFEMFVQGGRSIDRAEGGLGLGLAIVKSLVTRHGGAVSAHSDGPGRGSAFVIHLPAATASAEAMAPGSVTQGVAVRAEGRILVVDDNQDAAEMLAEALRSRGYETQVALDGPMALSLASTTSFDAALLDIGLPVMDGYELAGRLKALDGHEHLLLIAVTGYGQESDRQRARDAGFHHHMVKPIDIAALEMLLASAPRVR